MMTMERVPFSRSLQLNWIILGVAAFVFVAILVAALGRIIRLRFGAEPPRADDQLTGRWLLVTLSILNLVFVAAVLVLASSGGLLQGPLTGFKVALALPVLATLCALAAVYVSAGHWSGGAGTRLARLRYSTATVVALLFAWSLMQWNLLGWRLH